MSTPENICQLELPKDVYDRIEARLSHTEFDSVDEYVAYALEEVLAEVDEVDDEVAVNEDQVQDRLKSLGYLDE